MDSTIVLLGIMIVAVLGKADSVAIATCILLILKLLKVGQYIFQTIEKSGMYWGLVLLIASILVPIATGKITAINIRDAVFSWVGIAALILSFITTYLSGMGLRYLTEQGHGDIMPALIIGAVGAAAFLGGVPVGPLITSGMLAAIVKIFQRK